MINVRNNKNPRAPSAIPAMAHPLLDPLIPNAPKIIADKHNRSPK